MFVVSDAPREEEEGVASMVHIHGKITGFPSLAAASTREMFTRAP
jgi:hypothetical protein